MTDVLVVILVILPPLNWATAAVLVAVARRHPHLLTLRERAVAAVLLSFVATIAGVLAWVRLGYFALPNGTALLLLAVGLVIASVPNLYWLSLLARGRFRMDEPE